MTMIQEAVDGAIDALNGLEVDWAISGSFALAYHGTIRATHDADIKIRAPRLETKWARLEAEMRRRRFTVVDEKTFRYGGSFDVEFYPAAGPIDEKSFQRRIRDRLFKDSDREYWIVSAEDLIMVKLSEYRLWNDYKHIDDVKRLVLAKREKLDWEYLEAQLRLREGYLQLWKDLVEGPAPA